MRKMNIFCVPTSKRERNFVLSQEKKRTKKSSTNKSPHQNISKFSLIILFWFENQNKNHHFIKKSTEIGLEMGFIGRGSFSLLKKNVTTKKTSFLFFLPTPPKTSKKKPVKEVVREKGNEVYSKGKGVRKRRKIISPHTTSQSLYCLPPRRG